METEPGAPANLRVSRKNVRTGCIVCRIRKVKCDELKPACLRCTSTGRTCDGYIEAPPKRKGSHSPKYGRTPPNLSLYCPVFEISENISERRSFHYFRSRTVHDISGCFETEFWEYLVLQVSRVEPAVYHALLALSSLYEAYEVHRSKSRDLINNEAEPHAKFALRQYTKAIGILAKDVSANQPSLQGVLISCIIFVWIEFVKGNLVSAFSHLRSGLQIIRDLRGASALPDIDPSILRCFRRLHSQARLHGSPNSDFNSDLAEDLLTPSDVDTHQFSTIFEARECLDIELDSFFRFMRRLYNPKFITWTMKYHPFPDPLSLEATVQCHLNKLQAWGAAFQRISSLSPGSFDRKQSAGILLLQLQHQSFSIMVKAVLETSEMVFDTYLPEFKRIISLSERLILGFKSHVLSFDIGVIAPLFMVAIKCRYGKIRRQAIGLLKQAPDREGVWNRDSCIEFAELKVEMEERGWDNLTGAEPIPESARIHSERIRGGWVEGKRVTILRFKRGPNDLVGTDEFEEAITDINEAMGEML